VSDAELRDDEQSDGVRYDRTDVGADGGDPLDRFWPLYDVAAPSVAGFEARWWPPGALDRLIGLGLLREDACAAEVVCPACGEGHVEEVMAAPSAEGPPRYFIRCPEALRVEVPPALLRQWTPDFQRLARAVKELLGIEGRATTKVADRLWRLGVLDWREGKREAYLARGLTRHDAAAAVVPHLPCEHRPVVFVGLHGPPPTAWPGPPGAVPPPVVPLATVLSTTAGGSGLVLDGLLLTQVIGGSDDRAAAAGAAAESDLRRRVHRYAEERMAAGSDVDLIAALAAQGFSGREIAVDLKSRGVIMHPATVARKVAAIVKANLPRSSASVVRPGASRPRNKKGRPIPHAQPDPQG
jgi:hypothetical protein